MIKNIYDKNNKKYWHKYYCDYCFCTIDFGEILRSEKATKQYVFDLCADCFRDFETDNE